MLFKRLAGVVLVLLGSACGGANGSGRPVASDAAQEGGEPDASTVVSQADAGAPLTYGFLSLRRGINLADALEAPIEGQWGVVLRPEHFALAKTLGFDHVRVPVGFALHALAAPPYTVDDTFLARVDWVLDQAAAQGLAVVLDFHNYEALHTSPTTEGDRFVAIWTQVATRTAHRPPSVAFELLNEPHGAFDGPSWSALAARAVTEIRRTNPDRWIVIDGVPWADAAGLAALTLPSDPHVAATFHAYEPKLFTSQGSDWMGPEFQTTGVIFPGPPTTPLNPVPEAAAAAWVVAWFKQYNTLPTETNPSGPSTITKQFDLAEAFAKRAAVPVWVGEYAAVDGGDLTSRANYLRAVRTEAERRGMPWAYWDDGGHNKMMDVATGTANQALYDAMFHD